MKLEVDSDTIDKLIKERKKEFNKEVRDLTSKLKRRELKIKKLEYEIQRLNDELIHRDSETTKKVIDAAVKLVSEMQKANWVSKYYDSGCEFCADEYH